MTLLAVALAVVAVLLGMRPPTTGLQDRPSPTAPVTAPAGSPWLDRLVLTVVLVSALVLALLLGGPRTLVLVTAVLLVLVTLVRLLGLRRRRLVAAKARAAVVEAAEVLAANLRAGMVPAAALVAAAATCPVLAEARETVRLGGDAPAAWRMQARTDGLGGLQELARAWEVASRTGASLTGTLEQVAAALTADQSLQAVVGSELAAPRASGKMMAALPALGIGMGYLIGGDPLRWLASGVTGWACLLVGVGLACAGVLWIEALARGAAAQV